MRKVIEISIPPVGHAQWVLFPDACLMRLRSASNEKRGLFQTNRRAPREPVMPSGRPVCSQAGLLRGS